jgi:hypothetical protein
MASGSRDITAIYLDDYFFSFVWFRLRVLYTEQKGVFFRR